MTQICFFGVIVAHYKGSSRLRCGSSGLRFGSLGLNSAQWPLRFGYWAHLDLSGLIKRLRFGGSGLILADQDSGLAHWRSLLLFRTQYLAHLDPLGVRFGPSGLNLSPPPTTTTGSIKMPSNAVIMPSMPSKRL